MSMLDRIRGGTDSFAVQFVLVIVVVSFVFWGVGDRSGQATDVAVVNGHPIKGSDLNEGLRRAASRRDLSDEELAALRVSVLNNLIEERLLLDEAERLGLEVADAEIHLIIASDDAFKDEQGKFSASIYESTLKRSGMSRHSYEQRLREFLLRQKVLDLVARGAVVDPGQVRQTWEAENTTVSLVVVKVEDPALYPDVAITDDALAAFIAASKDAIQAEYDAQFSRRFNEPRKATLHTLLLRNDLPGFDDAAVKARAEAIHAELAAGADFAALARRWSEDLSAVNGGSLGTMAEEQLDPAIAAVVFGLEAGALSPVVATSRGYQILRVEALTPARVTSLEEATPILAREMIQAKEAPALAAAFAEQVLATWKAEGAVPRSLVESKGLYVQTVDDIRLADPTIDGLGEAQELLRDAQRLGATGVLDRVYTLDGQKVVAQVSAWQAPDPARFEQDATLIRQRLAMQERAALTQAWVDGLVAQADIQR